MSLFGDDEIIEDNTSFVGKNISHDGLRDPSSMSFCLGHEEQEKFFIDMYKKNNIPHAMIFSGFEGVGKTTMAFRIAKFLLKHDKGSKSSSVGLFGEEELPQEISSLDVDPNDPVSRRIASGGHADLLHIQRIFDKAKGKLDSSLKVETLRKIEPFLRKTSSEGGWRIVIIEDADTMNRNAQNAILKILEEPPKNVLIILVTHRLGRLIPTIHSRARKLTFSPLSANIMGELFHKSGHDLSDKDMKTLCDLSDGSFGLAMKYLENDGLSMLKDIIAHLEYAQNGDIHKIHAFSNSLSTIAQDKQYQMFVEILQKMMRKILFLKARGDNLMLAYLQAPVLHSIFDEYPLEKILRICDELKKHYERVEFSNLDRRDAVRAAFLMINQ